MGGLPGCLGGASRRHLKPEETGTILPDPRGAMTRRFIAPMLALSVIAAACTDTGGRRRGDAAPSAGQRNVAAAPKNGSCDDLDPSACLLPWPNDRLTRTDARAPTGLRVDLPTDGVPANVDGTRIDVSDQNRGDGFSPSSIAMVVIPGLDVERSKLPPSTDFGASLGNASPLVVLDIDANKRVPACAELDAAGNDPDATPLMIVPAAALVEGHTHVVALRNLVGPNGQPMPPNEAYIARLNSPDAHTNTVVEGLQAAKLDTTDMQLAWNFDKFAPAMNAAYPDPLDQALGRELIQMLWDRGENAGWAQHLTADTYDGAPNRNVLLLEAFGDHQLANVSTEKLARTLGVPRRAPTPANGRSNDLEALFGIPAIDALPTGGSGLVVWDFGTPAPPTINVPPRAGDDPHAKLATEPEALAMVAAFIDRNQAN